MNAEGSERLSEAAGWLAQAELNLEAVKLCLEAVPSAACFYAQQAADVALKGVYIAHGLDVSDTHSTSGLINGLYMRFPDLSKLRTSARTLDAYYIGTRYTPRGERTHGVAPGKSFTSDDAKEALNVAVTITEAVKKIYAGLVLDSKNG